MAFLTVALFTAACLSFKATRKVGLVFLALLYLAYPNATIVTLLVGGAYYVWRKHR